MGISFTFDRVGIGSREKYQRVAIQVQHHLDTVTVFEFGGGLDFAEQVW